MTPELTINQHIATITLRRPQQVNRLQRDDLAVLARHIATVNQQSEVLVLRIASTGRYFCSGFDINQIGSAAADGDAGSIDSGDSAPASDAPSAFERLANAVEDARPVSIAMIQGGVYGGATDLALACDFRLGVPGVDMFMPAARLGLHFYPRGLRRYVSRLGVDMAKRLFLTAQTLDAPQMLACGFLTHLVAADDLLAEAQALSATLAAMAPLALLGMKKHLNAIAANALDEVALHADIARAAASDDLREGALAWAQKRTPLFTGR